MESSVTFLRVRGIAIGAHWSWLFVFALVVWSLGTALFPATYPGLDGGTYLTMALVAAALFFTSVILHELGHAFRALSEGIRLEGITLWLLGGVARISGLPPSAGAEFRVAAAGPAVSLLLTALFGALALAGDRLGLHGAAQGVVDYLARINLLVLAFNLVPALPLDGGRVLRAWLWHRQRSFGAATRSAAKAGQAFGAMLVGIGLLGLFSGPGVGGIWLAFLGWFIVQAAQAEAAMALLKQAVGDVRVRDVMRPDPVTVAPDVSVADFLEQAGAHLGFSTYPVTDDGELRGLVSVRAAAAVPSADRTSRRVSDIMAPRDELAVVAPDLGLLEALQHLREGRQRAMVLDQDRLVGMLSGADVAAAVEVGQARAPEREPGVRSPGVLVWVVVALILLVAASLLYHPPYVVITPGDALDVVDDVRITGVPVDEVNGRYLALTVRLHQPTAFGAAVAALRTDRDVVALSAVLPPDVSAREYSRMEQAVFRESRQVAAAAAARAVGLPVEVSGSGVRVTDVVRGAPAAGVLRAGDVIVAVDARPVTEASDLQEVLRARPAGTEFVMTVERGGGRRDVRVTSSRLPSLTGGVGVGILVETRDLEVELPFEVRFQDRDVGGPSAGLAYALAMADLLDPADRAGGRTIAATGTIELDGDVGPVGGIPEKTVVAEEADADVLLVPAAELDAAREGDVPVRAVQGLEEALRSLAA